MNSIQIIRSARQYNKWRYLCNLTVIIFIMLFKIDMCISADNDVLAVGDEFELTQKDVEAIKNFYEKTNIRTTDQEYQKTTLRVKLFAKESVVLGLDKEISILPDEKDSAIFLLKLQSAYIKHVLGSYPVSDVVIESYYRTFPYRFTTGPDAKPVSKDSPVPINSEIKIKAREIIIDAIRKRIESEAEEKLKEKYHVKLIVLPGA